MIMNNGKVTRNVPYHLQVYQILRDEILHGQKKPGERIMESKIASEMGISRSPVREAIRLLEHEGLVIYNEGVLTIFPLTARVIGEIYQCRIAIEPYATFLATNQFTDEKIEELIRFYKKALNEDKQKNHHATMMASTDFHMLISETCGNKQILEISKKMMVQSQLARKILFSTHADPVIYLEEHLAVIEAIKERNPRKAELRMREHIENVWSYLQNYLENDKGGEILKY
jgi:DNA-binding GntR family transcriptional regulator